MAIEPIAILFGSPARLKLLRFFLFNPTRVFSFDDISRRAKLTRRTARTEIDILRKADLIKPKPVQTTVILRTKTKKVRATGYILNKNFSELTALQNFLFETTLLDTKKVIKHLRKAGVLDFVAVSGVFVRNFEQNFDLLLSMKTLSEKKITNALRSLENEIGTEIRFVNLTTKELLYRVSMRDKFTRDLFDYQHRVLVDRANVCDALDGYRGFN